jgi:hypothetical protein
MSETLSENPSNVMVLPNLPPYAPETQIGHHAAPSIEEVRKTLANITLPGLAEALSGPKKKKFGSA